jgi:ethanolamine transporter
MNPISFVMACFSLLGALDLIFGNKLGIGKQFEKGLQMLGQMAIAMIGMIVIAPLVSYLFLPAVNAVAEIIPLEPSSFIGILFANDMGGAPLAMEFAKTPQSGYFNGLIVGAMMGATFSFTVPVALTAIPSSKQRHFLLGLTCGIVTIPLGAFVSGLITKMPLFELLINLLPLLAFSILLAIGLIKAPHVCVKLLQIFGKLIKIVILIGLACAIFEFLTGIKLLPHTAPIQEGIDVIFNSVAVLTGAFPLIYLLSKVLDRPMKALGRLINVNEKSAIGFVGTLATNLTTFAIMDEMDDKGAVLNSAFAVSAAWVFAEHLAFTIAFNEAYVVAVVVGKLVAGISAILLASAVYKKTDLFNRQKETVSLSN